MRFTSSARCQSDRARILRVHPRHRDDSVVDKEIDSAEALVHGRERGGHPLGIGDVAFDGQSVEA